MRALKIVTLNCVSLIVRRRKQWLLNVLLKHNADVVFLQETKIGLEHVDDMVSFFERLYKIRVTKAVGHSGGTAIFVRKNRGITIFPTWEFDRNGRISAVDLMRNSEILRVVSVYAPNQQAERKEFFVNLRQYLDTPVKTIMAGDFNCVTNAKDCSLGLRPDSSIGELN